MAYEYTYKATITVKVRAASEIEGMRQIEDELQNQDKMDVEVQDIYFDELESTDDPELLEEVEKEIDYEMINFLNNRRF